MYDFASGPTVGLSGSHVCDPDQQPPPSTYLSQVPSYVASPSIPVCYPPRLPALTRWVIASEHNLPLLTGMKNNSRVIVFNTPTSSSTVTVCEPFCRVAQSSTAFVFTSPSKKPSRPLSLHKTIPLLLKQQVSASPTISPAESSRLLSRGTQQQPGRAMVS
ncbi:hypothetical protein BDM02DRAFT_501484 [Thelephora ganbajun]|uniref:Uncharacterized protein n=1 Tax=Thelephora ganbajun TaxID=370292 RepID=A0ACB6Z7L5_THEGA|nr:hypothetical protein BDM02DRAFT_501484 [Thelephora ganbajun]